MQEIWQPFNRVPNAQEIAAGLNDIPASWSLTPIQDKAPRREGWEQEPFIPHATIADLILRGESRVSKKGNSYTAYFSGYGLRTGEQSGGLLAIDVDGASAEPILQQMSEGELPPTPWWTSGKPGRRQLVFQIPEEIRPLVADFGRAVVKEFQDLRTQEGEQLEFRYSNHQSCLPPSRHPETEAYSWGCSPADTPVAIAPQWLCDLVVKLAGGEREESEAKQQQAEERRRQAEERHKQRQLNTVGAVSLEDVLEKTLGRLTTEDIYNWSGHQWHYQAKTLQGCCPRHQSASGRSFNVNTKTQEWFCFGCGVGGGPVQYRYFVQGGDGSPSGKTFIEILTELAADTGVQMPSAPVPARYFAGTTGDAGQKGDHTISEDEWQLKHGIPEWLRHQVQGFKNLFAKHAKLKFEPESESEPQPESPPHPNVIKYIPGKLPTIGEYQHLGSPTIQFAAGQRLQLIEELVAQGYHDILDRSQPGTGKSYDAGLLDPDRFGVDRLWYFSSEHRNPTVATLEGNFDDMPVRNDWMVSDPTRRTPLNSPHVRWPRPGETPNLQGNCFRTENFHILSEKGYFEVDVEAKRNPICDGCHLQGCCAGVNGTSTQPGASFRVERRDAFASDRIRSSVNSAPGKTDLAKEANAAIWDEAMRQIQPVRAVKAQLRDFDQMWAEVEVELPQIHEQLKHIRLTLRPIIAGQVAITQETYHGYDDATLRQLLGAVPADLEQIIFQLEDIAPDLEDILEAPDSFTKEGYSRKDRKGATNTETKRVRDSLRQEGYRQITNKLRQLASNWLVPLLKVWGHLERGALRVANKTLIVTTSNTRHAEIAQAMVFNIYSDGTAQRQYLALNLGIDPSSIVEIQQEPSDFSNLTIIKVTGWGVAGHQRSDSFKARKAAFKSGINNRHAGKKNYFLDHKEHSADDDGYHFFDSRGTNRFIDADTLTIFGTPFENIGALEDTYVTLTGDRNVSKDAPGFAHFVNSKVEAEIAQTIGRPRANLRPNTPIIFYSCCDFDLAFLREYYPNATITEISAFNIAPEAGTITEKSYHRVIQPILELLKSTETALGNLTQVMAASVAGVSQGRISQIAAKLGGWQGFKRLLAFLLDSPNTTANNLLSLDSEQQFIAETYLPLAVEESPPDAVDAAVDCLQAYGWQVFQAILAAVPMKTRGQLLAVLMSHLPGSLLEEFRSITPPSAAS